MKSSWSSYFGTYPAGDFNVPFFSLRRGQDLTVLVSRIIGEIVPRYLKNRKNTNVITLVAAVNIWIHITLMDQWRWPKLSWSMKDLASCGQLRLRAAKNCDNYKADLHCAFIYSCHLYNFCFGALGF